MRYNGVHFFFFLLVSIYVSISLPFCLTAASVPSLPLSVSSFTRREAGKFCSYDLVDRCFWQDSCFSLIHTHTNTRMCAHTHSHIQHSWISAFLHLPVLLPFVILSRYATVEVIKERDNEKVYERQTKTE